MTHAGWSKPGTVGVGLTALLSGIFSQAWNFLVNAPLNMLPSLPVCDAPWVVGEWQPGKS